MEHGAALLVISPLALLIALISLIEIFIRPNAISKS
jgi:hypothetical protein